MWPRWRRGCGTTFRPSEPACAHVAAAHRPPSKSADRRLWRLRLRATGSELAPSRPRHGPEPVPSRSRRPRRSGLPRHSTLGHRRRTRQPRRPPRSEALRSRSAEQRQGSGGGRGSVSRIGLWARFPGLLGPCSHGSDPSGLGPGSAQSYTDAPLNLCLFYGSTGSGSRTDTELCSNVPYRDEETVFLDFSPLYQISSCMAKAHIISGL